MKSAAGRADVDPVEGDINIGNGSIDGGGVGARELGGPRDGARLRRPSFDADFLSRERRDGRELGDGGDNAEPELGGPAAVVETSEVLETLRSSTFGGWRKLLVVFFIGDSVAGGVYRYEGEKGEGTSPMHRGGPYTSSRYRRLEGMSSGLRSADGA